MNNILKQIFLILVLFAFIISCKSKKDYQNSKKSSKTVKVNSSKRVSTEVLSIVDYAKTFSGTRYKYGGDSKKGMDCSGLVHRSFTDNNVSVPRTTTTLSTHGKWIDIKNIQVGDLVFFATKKNSRKINHVGIVTSTRTGHVEFIHASSSKGVMISSLANRYWYFAYVQARRML